MGLIELLILAVGLSMDAFAVSVCKGLSVCRVNLSHMLKCGLYFGFFQALMPTIGFFLGESFGKYITAVDHWVVFALLCIIGGNMLKESFGDDEEQSPDFSFKAMLLLALATSIDALAAGLTLSLLHAPIFKAALFIGIITFTLSFAGVKIGNIFGCRYKKISERVGGIILILMGTKILLEHLGVIAF